MGFHGIPWKSMDLHAILVNAHTTGNRWQGRKWGEEPIFDRGIPPHFCRSAGGDRRDKYEGGYPIFERGTAPQFNPGRTARCAGHHRSSLDPWKSMEIHVGVQDRHYKI